MASPIIIRPRKLAQGKYDCIALRLPEAITQLNFQEKLSLKENQPSHSDYPLHARHELTVTMWNTSQAQQVKPIREQNADDPLTAFLNYFKQ